MTEGRSPGASTVPRASAGQSGASAAMLYLNTVRHLQPGQLGYLAIRGLRRRLARVRGRHAAGRLAEGRLDGLEAAMCALPVPPPAVCMASADAVLGGEFRFIGEVRQLSDIQWGRRYGSPLWSFQLQYHGYVEDLARAFLSTGDARYLDGLSSLVTSWIAAPKPITSDAWSPYATARRLVHWIRALLMCRRSLPPSFIELWVHSISEQSLYLAQNIEWHLLGNHVQKNLHAVFCASALFDNGQIAALRSRTAGLLWQELRRQVLADGMHYERSPMYHADVLRDCREAAAVASVLVRDGYRTEHVEERAPADLEQRLDAMTLALSRFVRPDGSMHLFNDAANDAGQLPAALLRDEQYGAEPTVWALPDAGYYGFCSDRFRFIVDCGELGPGHQPAHGHCDLLSFELDIDGSPFIVDSGTSGYDGDPLREYVRSTRAHNTVQIAGREQHEMWQTFRVARRARVGEACIEPGRFTGSYSPFYSDAVVHERMVSWTSEEMEISDRVSGATGSDVHTFLHLHPEWAVRVDGDRVTASRGSQGASIELSNVSSVRVAVGQQSPRQGWYAPEFGQRLPAPVLEMMAADTDRSFGYRIRLAR